MQNSNFTITHSLSLIADDILVASHCNIPVLLLGNHAVGKSCIIENFASAQQKHLLKVHLGDQTDSKLLLGTYVNTAVPGQFQWLPGILTSAVVEGKWILLEDIHLAGVEVLAVLIPLLETRWLHVPSRGEKFKAHDDFRIFATCSNSTNTKNSIGIVGENLWAKVQVPVPTRDDISLILENRFPNISSTIPQLINVFETLKNIKNDLTFRDLIKWANRINQRLSIDLDPIKTSDLLFREAIDCFTGSINQICNFY